MLTMNLQYVQHSSFSWRLKQKVDHRFLNVKRVYNVSLNFILSKFPVWLNC